jgi:hypothetical protein
MDVPLGGTMTWQKPVAVYAVTMGPFEMVYTAK